MDVNKEALYSALVSKNRKQFEAVANKVFQDKLESIVWSYYNSIEAELKEKMASNKKDKVDD